MLILLLLFAMEIMLCLNFECVSDALIFHKLYDFWNNNIMLTKLDSYNCKKIGIIIIELWFDLFVQAWKSGAIALPIF